MQKFDNHGIMELVVLTRGLIQMRLLDFGRLIIQSRSHIRNLAYPERVMRKSLRENRNAVLEA
jgi:hypothetical protein